MKKSIIRLGALLLLGSTVAVYAGMQGKEQDELAPGRCVEAPDPCGTTCWGPAVVIPLGNRDGNFQTAGVKCGFCLWNFWVKCGPPETIPMDQPE